MHTGLKPFVCKHPGCGRAFRQAGKLSVHKKIHRNIIFEIVRVRNRKGKQQGQANGSVKSSDASKQPVDRAKEIKEMETAPCSTLLRMSLESRALQRPHLEGVQDNNIVLASGVLEKASMFPPPSQLRRQSNLPPFPHLASYHARKKEASIVARLGSGAAEAFSVGNNRS
jgi:hypothetical protein